MGEPTGLSDEQRRALDRLSKVPELAGYYLARGTAIAVHLSHRTSLDLDFFSRTPAVDLDRVKAALASCFDKVEVRAQTEAALHLLCDGLPVDFVCYPYPPLEVPAASSLGVGLAGLLDLAVMKLAAMRRGLRRDFWDLYEILQAGLTLPQCGDAYVARLASTRPTSTTRFAPSRTSQTPREIPCCLAGSRRGPGRRSRSSSGGKLRSSSAVAECDGGVTRGRRVRATRATPRPPRWSRAPP